MEPVCLTRVSLEDVIDRWNVNPDEVDLDAVVEIMTDSPAFWDLYWMLLDFAVEELHPEAERIKNEEVEDAATD
jgi:hypothetical protein